MLEKLVETWIFEFMIFFAHELVFTDIFCQILKLSKIDEIRCGK